MVTTEYPAGSPNWVDLGSPDTGAAAAFYGAVFGWEFRSAGPEAGGYGFFQQGGKTVAAVGPLNEPGAASAWTVYFSTPDADALAKAVEQGGGAVRMAPMDVMDAGRMALFTDPTGGRFAIWQPGRTKGLDAIGEPNTFCWAELHTADPAAAISFYQALYGWGAADSGLPGIEYSVLSVADAGPQDMGFGGVAGPHEGLADGWLLHFAVPDADAAVAATSAQGGSVVMPASDLPTVGRIAVLADPAGAQFAVIQPVPPQSA
ncbi:VOC family protein [Kitasatospora nipponensis]|uniref:VOC family protein n=1 Tax=Kitasatospora nipponensis TaxID=258049 RepID=A0ABP4HJT8_9ACTN